jgi:hypothetical protein
LRFYATIGSEGLVEDDFWGVIEKSPSRQIAVLDLDLKRIYSSSPSPKVDLIRPSTESGSGSALKNDDSRQLLSQQ